MSSFISNDILSISPPHPRRRLRGSMGLSGSCCVISTPRSCTQAVMQQCQLLCRSQLQLSCTFGFNQQLFAPTLRNSNQLCSPSAILTDSSGLCCWLHVRAMRRCCAHCRLNMRCASKVWFTYQTLRPIMRELHKSTARRVLLHRDHVADEFLVAPRVLRLFVRVWQSDEHLTIPTFAAHVVQRSYFSSVAVTATIDGCLGACLRWSPAAPANVSGLRGPRKPALWPCAMVSTLHTAELPHPSGAFNATLMMTMMARNTQSGSP
ncbi:hypothetical protein EJ03DRAFT_93869 [Teratosphaeria nubilosa]|uniref:Uncharacterized protein n=1 Tax=Teratosphaeria nubilosa TaxID=161662 RepID=A0A6G1LA95_9PEZI|nr:hypothetical protein EJ03DRAFT_93869 [Teratosphaeria nubilosa]